MSVTVQGLGVGVLTMLMRGDRRRDIDSSWMLFGPQEAVADDVEVDDAPQEPWRFAAE